MSDQPTPEKKPKTGRNAILLFLVFGCACICVIVIALAGYILLFDNPFDDSTSSQSATKLQLELGTATTVASGTVDPEGGTVVDTTTGVRVQVGEGFVEAEEDIAVSLSPATATNLPENLAIVSDVITLTKTSDQLFLHPVAVTAPYDPAKVSTGEFIAAYELLSDGTIQATTTIEVDTSAGTVTFLTTHFSDYILLELQLAINEVVNTAFDTGFDPQSDGWFITNWGSYITDGGNCMGMSAIAKYYYSNQKSTDGDWYGLYREGDLSSELDDEIAQELAARSQMMLGNRWNTLAQDLDRFGTGFTTQTSVAHGKAIIQNLLVTKQPQLVYLSQLFTSGKYGAAHAVLAYKYDATTGEIYLYDPNYPYRSSSPGDAIKKVKFSPTDGFEIYNSATNAGSPGLKFNVINHFGTNLITENKIMADLLVKAAGGFSDEEFPDIVFSSPNESEVVTEKSVVVTGEVSGGKYETEAGEKYMHWFYQNEKGGLEYVRGAVNADGTFNQELPVVPGTNHISALAAGEQPTDEWAGYGVLSVDATIQPADMLVTLKWDRPSSDIDLHVTDPAGEHVYYRHMVADSGAELDFDNTSGYGPEHYTISSAEGDTMPYGDYEIQVKYYADHDSNYESDQVIPWTVTVQWVSAIDPITEVPYWENVTRSGLLTSAGQTQTVYTLEHVPTTPEDFQLQANPNGVN